MTNQLETAKEWIADLNKIIDITDNECTKEKRDVLEWLVESVEELEKELTHQAKHFDICYYVIEKEKKVVEEQNQRYKQALERILDFYPGVPNAEYIPTEMLFEIKNIANKALEREG